MMKYGAVFTALAFSLFLLSGCDNSTSPNDSLLPIEGNINFTVQEFYPNYNSVVPPSIGLFLQTEKSYPCLNYSLKADIFREGNEILVKMRGVSSPPNFCITALGPATTRFPLQLSPGTYALHLSYRLVTDNYILEITDSAIRLRPESTHFTQSRLTLFWRYPPRTFAYYYSQLDSLAALSENFLSVMRDRISLEEFQFPDSGAVPYLTSPSGGVPDSQVRERFFRYQTELDFDRAGSIMKSFARANPGSGIWMVNWENKRYLSWVLEQAK